MASRSLVAATTLLLAFASSNAEAGMKKIDRGSHTWPKEEGYWVMFVARDDTLTGHAFVVWGVRNRLSNRWSSLRAIGLYPQDSGKPGFGTVPGHLVDESVQSLQSVSTGLAVGVTKQQFDYTFTNVAAMQTARFEPYSLVSSNCVDFVILVASSLGLKTKDRVGLENFPARYIEELKDANQ